MSRDAMCEWRSEGEEERPVGGEERWVEIQRLAVDDDEDESGFHLFLHDHLYANTGTDGPHHHSHIFRPFCTIVIHESLLVFFSSSVSFLL